MFSDHTFRIYYVSIILELSFSIAPCSPFGKRVLINTLIYIVCSGTEHRCHIRRTLAVHRLGVLWFDESARKFHDDILVETQIIIHKSCFLHQAVSEALKFHKNLYSSADVS